MKDISQNEFFTRVRNMISDLSDKLQKITIFNRTPGKKVIIIGFAVIVIAFALFSVIALVDEKAPADEETTAETLAVDEAVLNTVGEKPIQADFYFALTDSEKKRVISSMVLNFDSQTATIVYYFLPSDGAVSVNGTYSSFSGHLESAGTPQLILAADTYAEEDFERYAVITESALGSLFGRLGDTTVNVESRVSHEHNGISFIIDEGEQTLTPDMLLKYFIYLLSEPEKNSGKIMELIIGMVEKITASEDDTVLEDDFCTALGFFETDISALDFTNNKETIKNLGSMNLSQRSFQLNPEAVNRE